MNRGFIHTLDVLIVGTLIFILFISMPMLSSEMPIDILTTQKLHDLIIVWQHSEDLSTKNIEKIRSDMTFLFPEIAYEIVLDGTSISNRQISHNKVIAVEGFYIDKASIKAVSIKLEKN